MKENEQENRTPEQIAEGHLWQIHDELNLPNGHDKAEPPWIALAQDYLKKYFGPNSDQYKLISSFKFHDRKTENDKFGNSVFQAQNIIKGSIKYLNTFGLYKEPKLNFIYTWSKQDLITLFSGIIVGSFLLGGYIGNIISNKQNDSLERKVDKQSEIIIQKDSVIQNLQDTIIQLKLQSKSSIISLQDPSDSTRH